MHAVIAKKVIMYTLKLIRLTLRLPHHNVRPKAPENYATAPALKPSLKIKIYYLPAYFLRRAALKNLDET